jgi:hypothetical protein
MRRSILAALFVLILPVVCHAQPQTGTYPNGAFDTKTLDTINIGNLNVYFSLPVYSKPGRGLPFYYNLAYNSSVWAPVSVTGSHTWTPVFNWGWTADTDAQTGYVNSEIIVSSTCLSGGHHVAYTVYGDFVYFDTLGVAHRFPGVETSNNPTCAGIGPGPWVATANDSSGYTLTANSVGSGTVTSAAGKIITPPFYSVSGTGSTIDSNGNTISVNSSGQVEDTTGNTVLTVSGTAPTATTYTRTHQALRVPSP